MIMDMQLRGHWSLVLGIIFTRADRQISVHIVTQAG